MNDRHLIVIGFIVFIIAMVIIAAIVNYYQEKKRTEAIRDLARQLSFDFSPMGNPELMAHLGGFHLMGIGHSREIHNLLQGSAGELQISIFDYRYVTGSGKQRRTWQQSVFVAQRLGMDLPTFSMRPESIWHKIGHLFGMNDINFETHPRFSGRYLLKGPDEGSIRELFRPEVLEYFEERTGLNIEGAGSLLLYATYKRLDPAKIRDFMAEGFDILKLLQPATGPTVEAGDR
jgi:hypothetical protein